MTWVHNTEPTQTGFKPRKLCRAGGSTGDYAIWRRFDPFGVGTLFDAWFTRRTDGVLVHLGTAKTAEAAKEMCARDQGRGLTARMRREGAV